MLPPSLHTESLEQLYRRLETGEGDAEAILTALQVRADQAQALYALDVAALPQHYLDDYVERLEASLDPDPARDPVEDAAEREIARVQLEMVRHERERRAHVVEAVERGDAYAPPRPDILGSLMSLGSTLEMEGGETHFARTSRDIRALIQDAVHTTPAGALRVADILSRAEALPPEDVQHPLDPWMRTAIALEFLTAGEEGFGGTSVATDPITLAQAGRAKRLFYALDRQDARYDEIDWPLDLRGADIATLLATAAHADRAWHLAGRSAAELERYLTPTRREEIGRPSPHAQIQPERDARRRAEAAGGFPVPYVFPINPRERARVARQLWTEGAPSIAEHQIGIPLYSAGGDPRVRWGAPPFPYGMLTAITLPPEAVLRLHHRDYPDDEARFNTMADESSRLASDEQAYTTILRQLLLDAGVRAVARYDHLRADVPYPQEVALLDPAPDAFLFIRESVPSFTRGDQPLPVPARETDQPTRVRHRT